MKDTLFLHARFEGLVAETIEEIVRSGRAASKTEAVRLALLDYREHHLENRLNHPEKIHNNQRNQKSINFTEEQEKRGWSIIAEKSLRKIWDNESDDKVWNKY